MVQPFAQWDIDVSFSMRVPPASEMALVRAVSHILDNRSRPSQLKDISMPSTRRNVCARRSRRAGIFRSACAFSSTHRHRQDRWRQQKIRGRSHSTAAFRHEFPDAKYATGSASMTRSTAALTLPDMIRTSELLAYIAARDCGSPDPRVACRLTKHRRGLGHSEQ
jgi:hypothetical protein